MKTERKLLCAALALVLILSAPSTAFAANEDKVAPYIQQMLNYYKYYQADARTDIARLGAEIGKIDAAQAEAWDAIMAQWSWVNSEMDIHSGVLPDGLPEDDSLCIVVLGYELQSNGAMKSELIGRLKVALASAEKYPNAYIACTGGATASRNRKTTEAEQMASWLIAEGIDESRIIVENKSYSTVQNAQFTYELLRDSYPQVRHLALVTSDYHIPRGYLCFASRLILGTCVDMEPYLDIVGNAAYGTGSGNAESIASQAGDLARIAGVSLTDLDQPKLSNLTYISVDGQTVYEQGGSLAVTVTAFYDTGFSRHVTDSAFSTPVDMNRPGIQTMTVTYTENGNQATAELEIEILGNGPEQEIQQAAEPAKAAETADATVPATARTAPALLFAAAAALLALLTFFIRKLKRRK